MISVSRVQPAEDVYRPLTCHELLKWKFAHLNSVDFRLECYEDENGQLVSVPAQIQSWAVV